MRYLILALTALAAGTGFPDVEIISDQVEPVNLSFPRKELRRYLAALDYYAHIHKGFFHRGIGMPAPGSFDLALGGSAQTFSAECAIENESGETSAVFVLLGDGKELWRSPVRRTKDGKSPVEIDVRGVKTLTLKAEPAAAGTKCRHVCWGNVKIVYPDRASVPGADGEQLGILPPPPSKAPRINGARVYGVRPSHSVIFRVPATGEKPLRVDVEGLSQVPGLTYDRFAQTLGGRVTAKGEYRLTFVARNAHGVDRKPFTLKVGDTIALTPPMGWNSWNAFGPDVSAEKVLSAADALLASGLADHGWSYVNIDDFWENNPGRAKTDPTLSGPERDPDGAVLPNARFPDMRVLVERIHARGLKAGLYSSPGPYTCGRCTGSFRHEEQDARTYAKWGFDYLKYDWCTCRLVGADPDGYILPFLKMGKALAALDRDIVYSFNDGAAKRMPSLWGRHVNANCWRISGDVFDTWTSVSTAIDMCRKLYLYSAPGGWNDPDMLCVGPVRYNDFRESRLTPNEQYTHISMWALLAAPLMIGCDMTRMDDFTRSLLTNDEVIEIDQDELGKAAGCIAAGEDWEVWVRPLADGSVAAGLYNKSKRGQRVVFDFATAGLLGAWRVRDCWRQVDAGVFEGAYAADVPGHATHLVRLYPQKGGRIAEGVQDVRDAAWKLLYANGAAR